MKSATKAPPTRNKRNGAKPEKRFDAIKRALSHRIEFMPPNKLKPYERNPMKHPEAQIDQIVDSIEEFGFTVPVLIDENNMILAGHGRQTAALKMKLPRVPVIRRVGLSEAQKRAYIIADNKIQMNTEFDWQLITGELTALKELNFNLDLTGFAPYEVEPLLAAIWVAPDVEGDGLSVSDIIHLAVTKDQLAIYERAAVKMRKVEKDERMTIGRVLELLCADYLA
jgi:ParB-like chromosome segregation protein Spo0J